MNALELIRRQHAELERAIARLAAATPSQRAELVHELKLLYDGHAAIEEGIFYPSFKSGPRAGALDRYADEHHEIRALIEALQPPIEDRRFPRALEALAYAFDQHVYREEEAKLLPLVASMLGDDELDELGDEMLAAYRELMAGTPRPAPLAGAHV